MPGIPQEKGAEGGAGGAGAVGHCGELCGCGAERSGFGQQPQQQQLHYFQPMPRPYPGKTEILLSIGDRNIHHTTRMIDCDDGDDGVDDDGDDDDGDDDDEEDVLHAQTLGIPRGVVPISVVNVDDNVNLVLVSVVLGEVGELVLGDVVRVVQRGPGRSGSG